MRPPLNLFRLTFSAFVMCAFAILPGLGCGGAAQIGSPSSSPSPPSPPVQQASFGHVILVVEENHSYSDVIGNVAMPYLNGLASTYGLATQYYANLHPSMGNYFMLTTGLPVPADDAFGGVVNADNLVRELNTAGKTWKAYAESLPTTGYTGGDSYPYVKHHNPFVYLSDVLQQPAQLNNVVPFPVLAGDLSRGQLPNFSFVVPNLLNDAHSGSLAQADSWLQANIAPLLSSPIFQKDGLLIVTFDEGDITDLSNGGGHVATVVVSSRSKKKVQSTAMYQHQSTLRTILQALGISKYPGAAATAPAMTEFLQ
jgi:acid phosphatase